MKIRSVHACAILAAAASGVYAGGTSVNLEFNGNGSTLAATGFENVYMLDPTGFVVGGGLLTMQTLPGDDFGNYENDPDTARNMFFTEIQPLQRTVVEAKVRYENLNVNFHGGGIWFGTDQDHRVRFGLVHNSFEGGVSFEALRENQDLWPENNPPGPGNDIQGVRVPDIAPSPQPAPIDVILRMIRDGTGTGPGGAGASMFYSLDGGATFQRMGGPGFTFDYVVTGPGQGPNGGTSIEGNWKVGLHAFGGPDGQIPATAEFDYFRAESGDTAWANDAGGDYELWTNWTLGVPSAVEAIANFGSVISANRTVTITDEDNHNLGGLNLDASPGIGYTIASSGGGGLRFIRFNGGSATVNVSSGNHQVSAPVVYSTNTTWNVGAGAQLRLSGGSTFDNNAALTKTGGGLVETSSVQAAGLTVSGGVVRITPDGTSAATSRVGALSATGGQLDLTNNALVLSYSGGSPINDIRAQIASGFAGGNWNGNGIMSSTAATTTGGAVGYAEASALASIPSIFGTIEGDAILIRYTRFGDANLDGTVNLADFNRLAANFGSGDVWSEGDFNYDGIVNLADFNRLAANFGLSAAPGGPTPDDWAALASAVPEPSLALLPLAPALLIRRRKCRFTR